ncbi:hypothetical protein B0T21DRAFT_72016 [Apiosordaria backusii]|uniref:Uncharacterized protein n=1 Tax=Apiosordaria backusii TaxID=314023 RepID=A0AA40DUC0_9PEZI|nr:hypothetical protein B0T21DRAFT_72016 [Apiosordaria backusii]
MRLWSTWKERGKSPEPTLVSPIQLDSFEKMEAYHDLAECLLCLGDLRYAFAIKAELYRAISKGHGNFTDQERKRRLRMYVTDCIRIAQTEATAKDARQMLEENGLLYENWAETDNTWESVLFRILASRTYDSENSESSIIQIVEIINKTTVEEDEKGQEKLQTLTPRGYRFDVLMYKIFSYALERYNEPAAVDERPINVEGLLKQFKESQPAVKESMAQQMHPLLEWELLLKALDFCVSEASQISINHLELDNKSTRANRIFCTLWRSLRQHASSWKDEETYAQLAISATELLSIAIGMIVDEVPEDLPMSLPLKDWVVKGPRVIEQLMDQKDQVLIDKFLDKAYAMNVEIMLEDHDRKPLDAAATEQLNILRREAAQELGITDLPDLPVGAVVTQPLIADWIPSGHRSPKECGAQEQKASTGLRPRSRSRSPSHSPSGTGSSQSQSPATNGNTNGQASDASEENEEDRIPLD